MAPRKPVSATLIGYRVGFGDCFLLELDYATEKRHLLIDFGSRKYLDGGPTRAKVAADIARRCKGKLDAIVVTHRHGDHVSGFATDSKGKGTGATIAGLKPKLIVQPWTEHPSAKTNAKKPPAGISARAISFARTLHQLDALAMTEHSELQKLFASGAPGVAKLFPYLGEKSVKQKSAVDNLMKMAPNNYVFAGEPSGLEELFPGMTVTVLGPPTLEQHAAMGKQRSKDPDEFWQLFASTMGLSPSTEPSCFAHADTVSEKDWSPAVRQFFRRVRELRIDQLYEIVTALDAAMNNTSVNLLIKVGKQRLLFSGDAQIESWEYVLQDKALRRALSGVTLYKVGHHGSRNATPKSLWKLFKNRNKPVGEGRLITVLSTESEFHGHVEDRTEVPRRTLVEALKKESRLIDLRKGAGLSQEIPLDL